MSNLPAPNTPFSTIGWTDRFAFDFALALEGSGEPIASLLQEHNVDPTDMDRLKKDPVFLKKVMEYRENIQQHGLTFRYKARAQAEDLLETSWNLIHHHDVSPAVKADLIKWTAKVAGLEPKPTDGLQENAGGGVSITINLGDNSSAALPPPMKVINHE